MRLEDIDPSIAWQVWEPSNEEPWNDLRASLLHRRAGFGATEAELSSTRSMGPSDAVESFLRVTPRDQDGNANFQTDSDQLAKSVLATSDPKQLAAW